MTLPSSLLVLKFQRLLFLYCSSPFACKRPGLSLSRSATIPSSRSLSVRAASLAKTRALEGIEVQGLRGIAGLTGIQAELGRNSVLYMRLGSLTQKISSSVSENEEAGVEEEICDEARSVFVLLTFVCYLPPADWIRETGWSTLAGESLVNLKQVEAASVRRAIAASQVFLIV